MASYQVYLLLILLFVVLDFGWEQYLGYRNRSKMTAVIPSILNGIYNQDEYGKQQLYQKTSSRHSICTSFLNFVITLIVLSCGILGWLDDVLRHYIVNDILLSLVFLGIIYVVLFLISLPFYYYATFVIEQKFGFNKATKRIFWIDQLKQLFLTIVIGGVLLFLIALFYNKLGHYAWFYAWVLITIFSLFMTLFYSNLIVPLFNKQSPLASGELRNAIQYFAQKAGFKLDNIYVMDASKRTTKANAYFTGFGTKKRIVLFDSLINELSPDEIVAVLAHEIGHYKKKHTLFSMVLSIIFMAIILFLLSLFLNNHNIALALGGSFASFHLGLIAFFILFTPISLIWGIFSNVISRRNEYQADAFATQYGLGEALVEGLKKLSVKSLSNLNPDSWFVFYHYSHPTLLQRINAINKRK